MSFVHAARLDDLWAGETLALRIDGRRVLLVHHDEGICAFEDRCAHLGIPLAGNPLEGHELTCAAHGYRYDMRTGACTNVRDAHLVKLPVRIEAGAISIDLGVVAGAEDAR